jgi:hypothetical protein
MISANRNLAVFAVLSSLVAIGQTETQAKPAYNRGRTLSSHQHKISAAPPQEAPQPSPIPDLAPEDLPPQQPQVSYVNGLLTIEAQNATLGDICDAIGKQTGAQIDAPPDGSERFVVHLSGTPREVLSSLLSGSQIGYIILASVDDPGIVRKVILTKLEPNASSHNAPAPQQAAMLNRRNSAMARAMAAAGQSNGDDQEPPETTSTNGPNPAPLDTTAPFQPAPVTPAAQASGSDQNSQPISAPGQFMQELYRLRQQQQQQQLQQNQPAPAPPQQ